MTEENKIRLIEYMNNMSTQKVVVRQALFQQIFIVSTGILGFVVALHNSSSESIILFVVYISALSLLAITSVFSLFVLIGYASLPKRSIKEVIDNLKDIWDCKDSYYKISPKVPKYALVLQRITPWLFAIGVILLAIYSILVASINF